MARSYIIVCKDLCLWQLKVWTIPRDLESYPTPWKNLQQIKWFECFWWTFCKNFEKDVIRWLTPVKLGPVKLTVVLWKEMADVRAESQLKKHHGRNPIFDFLRWGGMKSQFGAAQQVLPLAYTGLLSLVTSGLLSITFFSRITNKTNKHKLVVSLQAVTLEWLQSQSFFKSKPLL